MRLAQLALHDHCTMQVQEVELLGVGIDLGLDRLGDQRGLALHVQDRLLGVEQGAVEGDGAVIEVQPADGALDGNPVVAGDIEDECVKNLQSGEAHHQAGDRAAAQRRCDMPPVNWAGRIHHGLPQNLLKPVASRHGEYLAFLGRISPEKRPDRAIEIAARSGRELRIAAKVDRVDRDYWREEIEPLVRRHANVHYIGEIGDAEKAEFLGNASALLFPIDWAEPFGLVMIEAMACGTPVIAFRAGSVPEIVDEGVTGFIVDDELGAAAAVSRIGMLDRAAVRATFQRRFSVERMALLTEAWLPLTVAVNSLNRSMGQPDLYPFVLSPPASEKLGFVHDLVHRVPGH